MPWKKPDSFMITRAKNISGASIGSAALINFFVPDAALIILSKYGVKLC